MPVLGDAIERAAADNRATMTQRAVSAVLAAVIMLPWAPSAFVAGWLAILAIAELIDQGVGNDRINGGPARQRQRWLLLSSIALSTACWSLIPAMLWQRGGGALPLLAILILCIQMMHAQSFGFRSRAMLALQMGIPAAVLALLVLSTNVPAVQQAVIGPALALGIAYVFAGAEANARAARALDDSRCEIERLAYTDSITGLANRRRFAADLDRQLANAASRGLNFTLVLLDLDGLKQINDRHGHDGGDLVLIAFGDALRAAAGPGDTVARLGGDEFGWLVAPGNPVPATMQPFCIMAQVGEARRQFCASVGAAGYPADGHDAATLFKAADIALYAAKPVPLAVDSKVESITGRPNRWGRRQLADTSSSGEQTGGDDPGGDRPKDATRVA